MQLSLQDCLDMLDITEDEVAAVAEHEHVPEIVAAGMVSYLIQEPGGVPKLRTMIVEDIERAEASGNTRHAQELRAVLRHFVKTHPCRAARQSGAKKGR